MLFWILLIEFCSGFDEFLSKFRRYFRKCWNLSEMLNFLAKIPEIWKNFDRTQMWKVRMVRSLADRTFQPRCALPWCFVDVDAADCDAVSTAEESLAFRGSGLHYSYAHCGVEPYQYHLAMYLAATSDAQLSRDPTNFTGLVLGCIEARFCK